MLDLLLSLFLWRSIVLAVADTLSEGMPSSYQSAFKCMILTGEGHSHPRTFLSCRNLRTVFLSGVGLVARPSWSRQDSLWHSARQRARTTSQSKNSTWKWTRKCALALIRKSKQSFIRYKGLVDEWRREQPPVPVHARPHRAFRIQSDEPLWNEHLTRACRRRRISTTWRKQRWRSVPRSLAAVAA